MYSTHRRKRSRHVVEAVVGLDLFRSQQDVGDQCDAASALVGVAGRCGRGLLRAAKRRWPYKFLFRSQLGRLRSEHADARHVGVEVLCDEHDEGVVLLQLVDDVVAEAHEHRSRAVRVVLLRLQRQDNRLRI